MIEEGQEARVEAYHAKYFCDEMAFKAIDNCMQIHGGIALTTDLPIETMWRQQRSYRITEGASEVMRTVIARHVMKKYALRRCHSPPGLSTGADKERMREDAQ